MSGLLKDLLPFLQIIIPALVAILTVWLTNKAVKQKQNAADKKEIYTADIEQMSKQREFLRQENNDLWVALKDELEYCRQTRIELEESLEKLRLKIARIEAELKAWELGLKVPKGFSLVKIDSNGDNQ
jgi:septal ring factor EnvC (AmiA/AmiB activator)